MAEKILYYFGAGASARALPLARFATSTVQTQGLAQALRSVDMIAIKKRIRNPSYLGRLQIMTDRFLSLAEKADEFGDVDTYAKYLYLTENGNDALNLLKQTLSEFFILKQIILNAQDSRYLPWLISIMNDKIFPQNIKILSWNYDFQIQLAFSKINALESIAYTGNSFTHTPSLLSYFPNLDPTFSDHHLLSLIHLNGIAGYMSDGHFFRDSVYQLNSNESIEPIIDFGEKSNSKSLIHFAWERNTYVNELWRHIELMIDRTTILVVIGYSFPFFNREIDKRVFDVLKRSNKFKKIYFQDPKLDGQQLKAQFDLYDDIKITHINSVENFHVPFEF